MKQIQKRVVFIGKSMLWSLLLYVLVMLAIYRDEVSNTIAGRHTVAVVNNPTPMQPDVHGPASIARQTGVVKNIVAIIRTISGFASVAVAG